jgi:hypothetical protein
METKNWKNIDTVGLVLSYVLCLVGFLVMNGTLLFEHSASYPPPSSWYFGLVLFTSGIVSFIVSESGRKFKQGILRVNSKIAFLLLAALLACFSLTLFPPFYII